MRRLLFFASLVVLLASCGSREGWHQAEGSVWNTTYHITYHGPAALADSVQGVLSAVDGSLSIFNPQSTVSRVNAGATDRPDTLLAAMVELSARMCRATGGRFDPTVRPLVQLWGFGSDPRRRAEGAEPTQREIDSVLAFVGMDGCAIDPASGRVVKKHPQTSFDFGAIAKGYACDLVAEMLRRNGVGDCLVEIGGELASSGLNPRRQPWRIQIDAPVEQQDPAAVVHQRARVVEVEPSGCGVATSGNYRNWRRTGADGRRVGHTIDPSTGRPYQSEILSATVVAPTCAQADALATACMASPSVADAEAMLRRVSATTGAPLRWLLIAPGDTCLLQFPSPGL